MINKTKIYFLFFIVILFSLLAFSTEGISDNNHIKYKIGVLVTGEKSFNIKKWAKTAQYLTAHIDGAFFEVMALGFDDFKKAVKENHVDFLIINPSIYVELEYYFDVQRLATIKSYFDEKPFAYYGSAVFTKSEREDIRSFKDLKWKNISAVHRKSFGGWLMAYRALKKERINPFEDFRSLTFEGSEEAVVGKVLEGKSDAGIIRTGILDRMILEGKIRPGQLKVLAVNDKFLSDEEKILSRAFPVEHSTQLYPEWIFAKTKKIEILLAEKVLGALLSIKPDHMAAVVGGYGGWTIPVSYQSVHDCLKELQQSPYDHIGKSALYDIFRKYRPWVIWIAVLFFLTVVFAFLGAFLNQRLSENSEKLQSVLNAIPHAVVGLENRRILFANEGSEKLFGWSASELKGKTTVIFYPNEEVFENVGSKVHAHFETEDSFTFEEITVRKDGSKIDCLIIVSKMTNYTKENRRAVAIYQDISQIKKILAQIEEQKAFLKEVINSLAHPFFVIDAETYEIQLSNAAAQHKKILGGQKCFFVAQEHQLSCSELSQYCPLDEVKETRKPAVVEHCFKEDRKTYYQEVRLYPIFNERFEVKQVIEYSFDITKRKEADEELKVFNQALKENEKKLKEMYANLEKAHKDLELAQTQLVQSEKLASIGQLAAGIAHEINNPTAFIYSNMATFGKYLDALTVLFKAQEGLKQSIDEKNIKDIVDAKERFCEVEKKIDPDFILKDTHSLLKETKSGLERIKNIVANLRTFSRQATDSRIKDNINGIIDGIINIVFNQIKDKAEIHRRYGDIPLVSCNTPQIGQVFMNLLMNASQAIDKKGHIWIRTYRKDKFVYIEVEDSGKGIPEDIRTKIFDPFFTTKPVGKGVGLGLSISYDIVKKHGGEIFLESQVGKGSKFIVSLPVA